MGLFIFARKVVPAGLTVVAVVLLFDFLKGQDFGLLWRKASVAHLLPGLFFCFVAVCLRAARWQRICQGLAFSDAFQGISIGILAGNLLFGAGEASRCATVHRRAGIGLGSLAASVAVERVFDLAVLALLAMVSVGCETGAVLKMGVSLGRAGLVFAAGLAIFLLLFFLKKWSTIFQKTENAWLGRSKKWFLEIFKKFSSKKEIAIFGLLTIGLRLATALQIWFCFKMFGHGGSGISVATSFHISNLSGLAGLLVPTQSGIGSFHFVAANLLETKGLAFSAALGLATAVHLAAVFFSVVVGLAGAVLYFFAGKKMA